MEEHRFVIALTFEQLNTRRARHLRAMVMWEPMLLNLPDEMPRVDFEEHKTRYRTLQAIARLYRAHPERFGIVKVWRPKRTGRKPSRRASFPTWRQPRPADINASANAAYARRPGVSQNRSTANVPVRAGAAVRHVLRRPRSAARS